jgi:hypothetical protein
VNQYRERAAKLLAAIASMVGRSAPSSERLDLITEALQQVAEESAPKWISVSERLPETNGDYLAVYQGEGFPSGKPYKRVAILLFTQGRYWSCSSLERVTHWMPLPPAPKEEAK